ncbi:hypothetical protein CPB86DRAFT_381859 [Serendipita vermifera]|nr:hypothetical protein CPB86DRAFT_381859 [Serendipita vermifera]
MLLRIFARKPLYGLYNQQIARYASPAPVFWRKGLNPTSPERKFSPLKMHLYAHYGDILEQNSLLLLLSLRDIPSSTLSKLRRELFNTTLPRTASNPFGVPKGSDVTRNPPICEAVRSHMFLAAMRRDESVKGVQKKTVPLLQGPIAILSLPTLDPDHLSAILKVLDRSLPKPTAPQQASTSRREDDLLTMPPPGGGGVGKVKPPPVPSLTILGGLVEGRLFLLDTLREVTKLPPLKVLHSQIVGLLTSPASQLAGILGQAAGGQVVRTLEGFRRSLEEAQKDSSS